MEDGAENGAENPESVATVGVKAGAEVETLVGTRVGTSMGTLPDEVFWRNSSLTLIISLTSFSSSTVSGSYSTVSLCAFGRLMRTRLTITSTAKVSVCTMLRMTPPVSEARILSRTLSIPLN